jgi:ATP-binding cassette subfamily B protein
MNHLKRLIPFLKPYNRNIVLLSTVIILASLFGQTVPYVFGVVVDEGIKKLDMNAVTFWAALLIGVMALSSFLNYAQGYLQGLVGADIVRDMRNALYRHLQYLPFSWYTKMPTGQIMSRMLSDLDAVEQFSAFGFAVMLREGLGLIFTLAVCLWLDWQLTLWSMIPIPFLLWRVITFRKQIDPAWEAVREQMGKLTTVLQENIAGVRVVKAFARETFAKSRFGGENTLNREKNNHRAKLEAGYFPSADFFSSMSFVILSLVGAYRLIDGTLSYGTFFAFGWYIWGIIWPMRTIGFVTNITRQAIAAIPRLTEILDAPLLIDDGQETMSTRTVTNELRGRIEFCDVHFSFPDDPDTAVLNGVSFTIEAGQTTAILGGTGSGKSSVINLVPRFYDVTQGSVKIDGVVVRDIALKELRSQIAIVPQETFLFSASLKDNIAFGKPDATLEEVIVAAQIADVHEFATQFEKGYDTKIGERGVGLSGGQRQRVALARAVLMNPPILILDEATSAVDTQTEVIIQNAMRQVMKDRTSLVVAQRLSTIHNADKIIVLKDGKVAEEGTHETLYTLGGEYRTLYDLQFEEKEKEVMSDEG